MILITKNKKNTICIIIILKNKIKYYLLKIITEMEDFLRIKFGW